MEPSGFEGRGGALVEQAKQLMKEDEEEAPTADKEAKGPKIKMSKIGRKKKGAADATADTKNGKPSDGLDPYVSAKKGAVQGGGAFTEQDVEFMKKAI